MKLLLGAHTCCANMLSIHEFTQWVWTPPITEIPCFEHSNAIEFTQRNVWFVPGTATWHSYQLTFNCFTPKGYAAPGMPGPRVRKLASPLAFSLVAQQVVHCGQYSVSGSCYPGSVHPLVVYPGSSGDYLSTPASSQEWLTKHLRTMFMHCMSKFFIVNAWSRRGVR